MRGMWLLFVPAVALADPKLPGDCVKPPPPGEDVTMLDVDGDGTPDRIVAGDECDSANDCPHTVYVMRGSCAYAISVEERTTSLQLLDPFHGGLRELGGTTAHRNAFASWRFVFDGKEYRGTAESDDATTDSLMKAARAADAKGDHVTAIATFEDLLAGSPDDAQALAELGYAELENGDLDPARDAERAALDKGAKKGDGFLAAVLFNLGQIAEKQGYPDDAVERYLAAAKHKPAKVYTAQALAAATRKVPVTKTTGTKTPSVVAGKDADSAELSWDGGVTSGFLVNQTGHPGTGKDVIDSIDPGLVVRGHADWAAGDEGGGERHHMKWIAVCGADACTRVTYSWEDQDLDGKMKVTKDVTWALEPAAVRAALNLPPTAPLP